MAKAICPKFDILVLGAGIIGVSTAWHLQRCGKKTALLDRTKPGLGASFGNAGLIERSSVIPYHFPRRLRDVMSYATNRQSAMRYDFCYLPKIAPWLYQFWHHSSPPKLQQATQAMLPLIERSLIEHEAMIRESHLHHLRREGGWIEIFRDEASFRTAKNELPALERYHLNYEILDIQALKEREPALTATLAGAIHWLDPHTITAPDKLVEGYCQHFMNQGGYFFQGNALSLTHQAKNGWQVATQEGMIEAAHVVIALGWESDTLIQQFSGRSVPLAVKRGYHMHYQQQEGRGLNHPLCDSKAGFVLAPMQQGLRLTTGIEFAAPDAAANDIQLRRCEHIARQYCHLGTRLDEKAWLGRRPCLPDMRPIISAVEGAPAGLWANFGHAHHGLTLGPVSGRLLTQMILGEKTFAPPAPFSITRFY